jgi:PPOX class probable F420-dependent enzyme
MPSRACSRANDLPGPPIRVTAGGNDGNSYKVKRIRRNDNVTVAPCNAMGRVTGDVVPAHAAILSADDLPRVERLLHRKYRLDYIFVLPIYLLVQRLRGRPLRYETPMILSITPT